MTEEEFDAILNQSTKFELILFTAPAWCAPCQRFEPHWEKAKEQLPDINFIKVDMGASPEDTGDHWATKRFGVRGVPSLRLIVSGEPIEIKARAVIPLVNEVNSHV